LAYAEELIPSGLAAIFISVSPFWLVGFEAMLPGGVRLHGPTIAAMMVGLLGTVLLVGPSAIHQGLGGPVLSGFLLLQLGSCGWSLGSILQRRYPTRAHPVISGAVQQLATGVVYAIPALLLPAPPIRWTARGVGAALYLVVFGSIVGYSAYLYALEHLPVSVVSIYNYVNPVVAVFLGWLFYREAFGVRELFAMGIIFVGVALVKRASRAVPATPLRAVDEPRVTVDWE
jgi:drug/metabolite transporter (DMT)-like permease